MTTQVTTIRPRWRRIVRRIAIGIVGLFLIALVANAVWGYVEASHLQAEIHRIKAAGEPLTFKDLDARPPKMDEADDAGPYYDAALALLRHKDPQSRKLWDAYSTYSDSMRQSPTSRPSKEVCEIVDRFLADNTLTLQMLDLAAQRPACRFKVGVEAGFQHMKSYSRMRAMAKLLSLQALIRASAGRPDEAADSVVCLLRMLRMFDQQPIVIAHLVKMAIASMACLDAKTVLETARPTDAKLALLQEALLATDTPRPLEPVILAERVYGIELFGPILADSVAAEETANLPSGSYEPLSNGFWVRYTSTGVVGFTSGQWQSTGFWVRPMARHMVMGYLREMSAMLGDARRPLPEVLSTIQSGGQAASIFGATVAPALGRGMIFSERAIAEIRCAAVAIMIERYRRATGHLPQSLHDLIPKYAPSLPIDPFTGKELVYHRDEKSYVVYSLGEDQKDDNGYVERGKDNKGPLDFGCRIRLPAGR